MGFRRGDQGAARHELTARSEAELSRDLRAKAAGGLYHRCNGGGSKEGPCFGLATFVDQATYPSGARRRRELCDRHAQRCAQRWGLVGFECAAEEGPER